MIRSGDVAKPRRIVLSRKGFDSSYGGMPSPILPDGRLVPLPIPARHDQATMADLRADDVDLEGILADLSGGQHSLTSRVHLDPDLDRRPDRRPPGWRPSLGQTGAAQSHLAGHGVGPGDVFLFFGWFRQAEIHAGRWRYARRTPHLHVLFGWLEIEDALPVVLERQRCLEAYPWIADHPHVRDPSHYTDRRNTVYVAPTSSRLAPGYPGGGFFPRLRADLQLTMPGQTRSVWRLPSWMMPNSDCDSLSYHADRRRWSMHADHCLLKTVAKGQEFVLDAQAYPDAAAWVVNLVTGSHPRQEGSST